MPRQNASAKASRQRSGGVVVVVRVRVGEEGIALSGWVTKDIVAVSIEAHAPKAHASHKLLRLF